MILFGQAPKDTLLYTTSMSIANSKYVHHKKKKVNNKSEHISLEIRTFLEGVDSSSLSPNH